MSTRSDFAVVAHALAKTFGAIRAVDSVDLSVPAGSIYGILGPNGAGKTTVTRMLATLTRPDSGSALILGHDLTREADAIRRRVSLMGQFASLDEDLTGRENLVVLARLLGYRRTHAKLRADELIDGFDLRDATNQQVKNYSGGMRRRLDIAASIVVTPELLFLDEPTTGLDPRSRNQVWQIIRLLAAGGCTVMLTTQYLDEADQLADRIAVIDHGTVIAEGTSSELKSSVGSGTLRVRFTTAEYCATAAQLLTRSLEVPVNLEGDPTVLSVTIDPAAAAKALADLSGAGIEFSDFALDQPSLDEVFLALTGNPALITSAVS